MDYVLPCPECLERYRSRESERTVTARIGNQRTRCRTCNAYVQNVRRALAKRLHDRHREEVEELRPIVELEQYRKLKERWESEHPLPERRPAPPPGVPTSSDATGWTNAELAAVMDPGAVAAIPDDVEVPRAAHLYEKPLTASERAALEALLEELDAANGTPATLSDPGHPLDDVHPEQP